MAVWLFTLRCNLAVAQVVATTQTYRYAASSPSYVLAGHGMEDIMTVLVVCVCVPFDDKTMTRLWDLRKACLAFPDLIMPLRC